MNDVWIKFPIQITRVESEEERLENLRLGNAPVQKISWVMVRMDQIVVIRPFREEDMVVSATVIGLSNGEYFTVEALPSVVEAELRMTVIKVPYRPFVKPKPIDKIQGENDDENEDENDDTV